MLPGASPKVSRETMNINDYARWMVRTGVFAEIVLIADCNADANLAFEPLPPPYPLAHGRGRPSSFFFCWSTESDRPDGGPLRPLTSAILSGLSAGAVDPEGKVTTSTLRDYLITDLSKRGQAGLPKINASDDLLLRIAPKAPVQEQNIRKKPATKRKPIQHATKKQTKPKKKKK